MKFASPISTAEYNPKYFILSFFGTTLTSSIVTSPAIVLYDPPKHIPTPDISKKYPATEIVKNLSKQKNIRRKNIPGARNSPLF